MKLDWKRAGQASIAAMNNSTFIAQRWDDGKFGWHLVGQGSVHYGKGFPDLTSAESACEAWAEEYDYPVWREDRKGWLWSTVWRGHHLILRYDSQAIEEHRFKAVSVQDGLTLCRETLKEAQTALENLVRHQV